MKVLTVPASGSVGGVTYQGSRAGTVVRSRRMPTRPLKLAAPVARATSAGNGRASQSALVGVAARAWRGLTDAQRAAWRSYGEGSVSPWTWFLTQALRQLAVGGAVPVLPLSVARQASEVLVTLTLSAAGAGAFSIAVHAYSLPLNYRLAVSGPVAAGATRPGSWSVAAVPFALAGTTTTTDLHAWVVARSGALRSGQRYWVRVDRLSERVSWQTLRIVTQRVSS